MRTIELLMPEISGQTATFRWRMDPEATLYKQPCFQMNFEPEVDLGRISPRLWLDIMLLCLHQHWLLLRPCRVVLPASIEESERRFWLQLLKHGSDALHFTSEAEGAPPAAAGVDIVGAGPRLEHRRIHGSGVGTAFSSGKDSLLQAALLFELTGDPLLVTTTSPLPPLQDHETVRRREVFDAIRNRRTPLFREVVSDFRANWDNGFAGQQGYAIAVNELTDTFLYTSSLLVAGAAAGRTRLFLASEAEVQENAWHDGAIVQHPHFMYSAATHRAISRYLEPHGLSLGSLIWPLYSRQVQQLLWARYPDIADLQYSCWRVTEGQKTCSACEQCLRTAMTALADGHDPARMGIDLVRLMAYSPEWQPVSASNRPVWHPASIASARARGLVVQSMRAVPPYRFAAKLFATPRMLLSRRRRNAFAEYRRLRQRFAHLPLPPAIGVRQRFFEWLDPELRPRLEAIFRAHFPIEPRDRHDGIFERSETLTDAATSALETQAFDAAS